MSMAILWNGLVITGRGIFGARRGGSSSGKLQNSGKNLLHPYRWLASKTSAEFVELFVLICPYGLRWEYSEQD